MPPTGGAPHTQRINPAASERSTQDARCLGLAGIVPEARARAAQPKRGRQPARPTRLPRGAAAAATKKVAKILIISPPHGQRGPSPRGRGPAAKKVAQGRLKKIAKIFLPPQTHRRGAAVHTSHMQKRCAECSHN